MTLRMKILNTFMVAFLIVGVPTPSSGFGMMKGGGGGGGSSSVGEILAAGLITGMLMNNGPSPVMQALRHPGIFGGYGFAPSRHPMHTMLSARVPMMRHYAVPMMYRPQYMLNQALITEATRHQALASRLNEEIRALEAQESILEAYLSRHQQGNEPALNELLNEEDTIPAAALLLGSELMNTESGIENAHHQPQPILSPDMFQAAPSEPESRYLLPRIVRHFVQRLIRRAEHHH